MTTNSEENNIVESATPTTSGIAEITLQNEDASEVRPSELLGCSEWLNTVCELFSIDLTVPDAIANITEEDKEKADLLVKILKGRLHAFMNKRNVDGAKRNHWAIQLAIKNLSFVAAYMVLVDHVKSDLSCLDETQCLLTHNQNRLLLCQSFNDYEGAYLYWDTNNGRFIRSGKVCGRGFHARHSEHLREAGKNNPKSDFYLWYPTKTSARATSKSKRGLFDSLTQYIAGGWDPNCAAAASINKSYEDGGVMVLNESDKSKINASMRQTPDSHFKFRSFLAYQLELGYDLAISPSDNVSGSFGFESFVGLFI